MTACSASITVTTREIVSSRLFFGGDDAKHKPFDDAPGAYL